MRLVLLNTNTNRAVNFDEIFYFFIIFISSQKGTIKLINAFCNEKKVKLFHRTEDSLKFYNKYLPEVKVFSFKFDEGNAVGLDIF